MTVTVDDNIDYVIAVIRGNLSDLKTNMEVQFLLKQLCGHNLWRGLTTEERRILGKRVACLVVNNDIPLRFGVENASSKTYIITP